MQACRAEEPHPRNHKKTRPRYSGAHLPDRHRKIQTRRAGYRQPRRLREQRDTGIPQRCAGVWVQFTPRGYGMEGLYKRHQGLAHTAQEGRQHLRAQPREPAPPYLHQPHPADHPQERPCGYEGDTRPLCAIHSVCEKHHKATGSEQLVATRILRKNDQRPSTGTGPVG